MTGFQVDDPAWRGQQPRVGVPILEADGVAAIGAQDCLDVAIGRAFEAHVVWLGLLGEAPMFAAEVADQVADDLGLLDLIGDAVELEPLSAGVVEAEASGVALGKGTGEIVL